MHIRLLWTCLATTLWLGCSNLGLAGLQGQGEEDAGCVPRLNDAPPFVPGTGVTGTVRIIRHPDGCTSGLQVPVSLLAFTDGGMADAGGGDGGAATVVASISSRPDGTFALDAPAGTFELCMDAEPLSCLTVTLSAGCVTEAHNVQNGPGGAHWVSSSTSCHASDAGH